MYFKIRIWISCRILIFSENKRKSNIFNDISIARRRYSTIRVLIRGLVNRGHLLTVARLCYVFCSGNKSLNRAYIVTSL